LLEEEQALIGTPEVLVKAYLRRAMAYESLEKLVQCKLDLVKVK